ncbi:MAG: sugar phosphate isomerase/epimerase family protein [Beijerinckiaceae bacterium]
MTAPSPSLPVLGVAVPLSGLRMHRDWILESQRDLELQDFFFAEALNGDWKTVADQIRTELDGYRGRLGLHGPFWGFTIASKDPDVRDIVKKRMRQCLDVCAYLGATQMVIHSPYTTWDYNNLDDNPGARADVIARSHETLKDAVKQAEDIGCVLVIENIEDKDAHSRVELARSFNSDSVRVSIDTGHANYAYGSTGAPPVDYYVHAAGDMLHHVHLQDTDGFADRHWAPGEGNIAWTSVFRALARLNSNPRLILELRRKEEVRAGADHLIGLGLAV